MGEQEQLFRIFVGGLFPSVTKEEVSSKFRSFGSVADVELIQRKDEQGVVSKTFGYINLTSTNHQVNRCFALFGGTKWKGHELKVQLAKDDFMKRLAKEREDPDYYQKKKLKRKITEPMKPYAEILQKTQQMKKALPGTLIEGEKNWVIGKYGRPLPIVYIPQKTGLKTMKFDPSKQCHCLRKLPDIEDENLSVNNLTWHLDDSVSLQPVQKKKKRKSKENRDSEDESFVPENDSSKKKNRKSKDGENSPNEGDTLVNESGSSEKKRKKLKKAKTMDSEAESPQVVLDENNPINGENSKSKNMSVSSNGLSEKDSHDVDVTLTKISTKNKKSRNINNESEKEENNDNLSDDSDICAQDETVSTESDNPINEASPTKSAHNLSVSIIDQLLQGKTKIEKDSVDTSACNEEENERDDMSDEGTSAGFSLFDFGFDDFNASKKKANSKVENSDGEVNEGENVSKEKKSSKIMSEENSDSELMRDGDVSAFDFDFKTLKSKSSTIRKEKTESVIDNIKSGKGIELKFQDEEDGSDGDSDSTDSESGDDFSSDSETVKISEPHSNLQLQENKSSEEFAKEEGSNNLQSSETEKAQSIGNAKETKKKKFTEEKTEKKRLACEEETKKKKLSEEKTVKKKKLSEEATEKKRMASEQARQKSLEERTKKTLQLKATVKTALKDIDAPSTRNVNKIVFEDSDDDNSKEEEEVAIVDASTKLSNTNDAQSDPIKNLFDESSEDSEDDDDLSKFEVKRQFQGEVGEKLFQMQQRFGGDERFRLDERFADDVENSQEDPKQIKDGSGDTEGSENEIGLDEEKKRNLSLLAEVLDEPFKEGVAQHGTMKDKTFERYDPMSADHEKYEVKEDKQKKKKRKTDDLSADEADEAAQEPVKPEVPVVSDERYFDVNQPLKNLFAAASESEQQPLFSFLADDNADGVENTKDGVQEEKTSVNDDTKKELSWKRALEETSRMDVDEEDDMTEDTSQQVESKQQLFFFTIDDERLEIGKSFKRTETMDEITNQWQSMRSSLSQDFKKRHKDAVRRVRKLKDRRFNGRR